MPMHVKAFVRGFLKVAEGKMPLISGTTQVPVQPASKSNYKEDSKQKAEYLRNVQ